MTFPLESISILEGILEPSQSAHCMATLDYNTDGHSFQHLVEFWLCPGSELPVVVHMLLLYIVFRAAWGGLCKAPIIEGKGRMRSVGIKVEAPELSDLVQLCDLHAEINFLCLSFLFFKLGWEYYLYQASEFTLGIRDIILDFSSCCYFAGCGHSQDHHDCSSFRSSSYGKAAWLGDLEHQ